MSIISAGTLLTNALTHTADRTGRLVFQTNGTTTALTLDSSQDATFAGGVTVTGNLTVAGTTTSFGDNDKIVLGDGDDLQLYHDGSNSYIKDNGTGSLILEGVGYIDGTGGATFDPDGTGTDTATDVVLAIKRGNRIAGYNDGYIRTLLDWNTDGTIEIGQNSTSIVSDISLRPGSSGSVQLYEGGSVKLETTSTGVAITGDLTVNGAPAGRNPTLVDSDTTAVSGNYYVATAGGITITLPLGPDSGDYVEIHDGTGAAATTNITVGRNGENITGSAEDFTLDVNYAKLHMVYVGGSVGWTV